MKKFAGFTLYYNTYSTRHRMHSKTYSYSYLSDSTGFVRPALNACILTVARAISMATPPDNRYTPIPISIRYANVSSNLVTI